MLICVRYVKNRQIYFIFYKAYDIMYIEKGLAYPISAKGKKNEKQQTTTNL